MEMNMRFDSLDKKYIEEALELVLSAYHEEKEKLSYLPDAVDFIDNLRDSINELFNYGIGVIALIEGKLAGFIAGFEVEELFGKCKGIYCPLYGHGAAKEIKKTIYKEMYKQAAKI